MFYISNMSDDNEIDTDIENYTIEDILSIFNIIDPNEFNVTDVANTLIAKMKTDEKPDLERFFGEARDKVLDYIQNIEEEDNVTNNDNMESIKEIWDKTGLKNDSNLDSVNYYGEGSHVVIEPQQRTSSGGPAAPMIATHIVNIDSQYRSNILPYNDNPLSNTYNTSFTFNLTNPITKATSLRLYSYQIPTSWYAFNARSGNTFFMYNGVIINIPDGNYTPSELVSTINTIAQSNIATQSLLISYNAGTNRISFINNDTLSLSITVIFFIQSNVVNFNNCGSFVLSKFETLGINTTLGWLLGFRTDADATTGDVAITLFPGEENKITADVPPDTYGPKYFVLSVEDYGPRLSSGLYNITSTKNYSAVSITDFYKTTRVACRLREGSLTQAEQYTIDAITDSSSVNNLITGFNNKLSGPNSGSAFAIIPLRDIKNIRPDPYVQFGADLAVHKRNYVAPSILQRFSVRLTDDKGNLVNLYDNDWSFSMIVEERLN